MVCAAESDAHTIRDLQYDVRKLRGSATDSTTKLHALRDDMAEIVGKVRAVIKSKRRESVLTGVSAVPELSPATGAGAGAGAGAAAGSGTSDTDATSSQSLLEQAVTSVSDGSEAMTSAVESLLQLHVDLSQKFKSFKKATLEWAEREKTRRRARSSVVEATAPGVAAAAAAAAAATATAASTKPVAKAARAPTSSSPARPRASSATVRRADPAQAPVPPTAAAAAAAASDNARGGSDDAAALDAAAGPSTATSPSTAQAAADTSQPSSDTEAAAASSRRASVAVVNFPAPKAVGKPLPSQASMGKIFARTHHPGRLHVRIMGWRHVPHSGFGLGAPHGYVHLSCFGQRQSGQVVELFPTPTHGLSGPVEQQFTFVVSEPFTSSKALLYIDVVANRTLRSDTCVVRGCAEVSRVEHDPSKPHAMWVQLREPKGKLGMEPDPKEVRGCVLVGSWGYCGLGR